MTTGDLKLFGTARLVFAILLREAVRVDWDDSTVTCSVQPMQPSCSVHFQQQPSTIGCAEKLNFRFLETLALFALPSYKEYISTVKY